MRGTEVMDVELDAVIRFQQTNETITCVVRNVTGDYTDVIVAASDPRICEHKDVDLAIILPADRSPVKCVGRIIWHLEDDMVPDGQEQYLARIFITDISRVDQRRLELLADRRQAFVVNGYPRTLPL